MAFVLVGVDTCRACAGWGQLRADRLCLACWNWSQRTRRPLGSCRRCAGELLLNGDGMCRLCVLEVRYHDEEWLRAEAEQREPPRRGLQTSLLLQGVRLASAQPLSKQRTPRVDAWRSTHPIEPRHADTGTVCPPQIPGQRALFWLPRRFTAEHAATVAAREVPDLDWVRAALDRRCVGTPTSAPVRARALAFSRLALLARESDDMLVREEILDGLPRDRSLVAALLAVAGLLRPRRAPPPRRRRPTPARGPDSCAHCLAWSGPGAVRCERCVSFARRPDTRLGTCDRCARDLPLVSGLCRFCHVVLTASTPPVQQLWLGGALGLDTPHALRPLDDPRRGELAGLRARRAARPPHPTQVSAHLVDAHQTELFPSGPRDWSRLLGRPLPALTGQAQNLLDGFDQTARDQRWEKQTWHCNRRVLALVLAWLGIDAPIREADLDAVALLRTNYSSPRAAQFLAVRQLLVPDPARAVGMDEAAVHRLAATTPAAFRGDVDAWIRVLRGEGSRPSPRLSWTTIRRYLGYVLPVLTRWHDQQIHSLRQITTDDVTAALAACPHPSKRSAHSGLRSLFRALRRERRIFRDPARPVQLTSVAKLPRPLPSDRVQGLLDRAPTPMAAAAIALIAVHAVHHQELLRAHLDDLDRARGRLVIRRPGTSRTAPSMRVVYLDELTLRLLTAWLHERHRLWPRSTNPHLFVSRRTAMNTDGPPINKYCLYAQLRPLGVLPSQLWTDRVLDEAAATTDPVQLMRVFGLSKATAIKYVTTAHPERFTIDPTQP